jgi:hypothetical protein
MEVHCNGLTGIKKGTQIMPAQGAAGRRGFEVADDGGPLGAWRKEKARVEAGLNHISGDVEETISV